MEFKDPQESRSLKGDTSEEIIFVQDECRNIYLVLLKDNIYYLCHDGIESVADIVYYLIRLAENIEKDTERKKAIQYLEPILKSVKVLPPPESLKVDGHAFLQQRGFANYYMELKKDFDTDGEEIYPHRIKSKFLVELLEFEYWGAKVWCKHCIMVDDENHLWEYEENTGYYRLNDGVTILDVLNFIHDECNNITDEDERNQTIMYIEERISAWLEKRKEFNEYFLKMSK